MMAKQSAYLQRRNAELDAVFWAGAAMAAQFAVDTLQMALHWIGCLRRSSAGRQS